MEQIPWTPLIIATAGFLAVVITQILHGIKIRRHIEDLDPLDKIIVLELMKHEEGRPRCRDLKSN